MLIGCYYYAWYEGDWLDSTVRGDDPPVAGQYRNSSHEDMDVLVGHMRQIRDAGIDFVSVSWWPGNDQGAVLAAAAEIGVKVTFLYESLQRANHKKFLTMEELPAVLEDMKDVVDFMEEESWLRIDGRPVLMLYVTRNYRDPRMFDAIRDVLGDVFLVGDELFWKLSKVEKVRRFDAATGYNMYHPGKFSGRTAEERSESFLLSSRAMMEENARLCREAGVGFWPVVMPGYDDSGVRPSEAHPSLSRLGGEFLKRSLDDALMFSPPCMMVTSFNEWYEDTQVEPAGSYGRSHLRAIRRARG
jgi:hypothetical protein